MIRKIQIRMLRPAGAACKVFPDLQIHRMGLDWEEFVRQICESHGNAETNSSAITEGSRTKRLIVQTNSKPNKSIDLISNTAGL